MQQIPQIRTFAADVRAGWAVAYDPADPPGCNPGGLIGGGAAPSKACTAYLLQRSRTRWEVVSKGIPGSLPIPDGVPEGLGQASRLSWLER